MLMITLYAEQKKKKKTQIYRTVFWTLWEEARVGCLKRTASKQVYYLGWNSIETGILSRVERITSPGWMHETSAQTWCNGKT